MSQLILGICWLLSPLTRMMGKVLSLSQQGDELSSSRFEESVNLSLEENDNGESVNHVSSGYYDPSETVFLEHPWT